MASPSSQRMPLGPSRVGSPATTPPSPPCPISTPSKSSKRIPPVFQSRTSPPLQLGLGSFRGLPAFKSQHHATASGPCQAAYGKPGLGTRPASGCRRRWLGCLWLGFGSAIDRLLMRVSSRAATRKQAASVPIPTPREPCRSLFTTDWPSHALPDRKFVCCAISYRLCVCKVPHGYCAQVLAPLLQQKLCDLEANSEIFVWHYLAHQHTATYLNMYIQCYNVALQATKSFSVGA